MEFMQKFNSKVHKSSSKVHFFSSERCVNPAKVQKFTLLYRYNNEYIYIILLPYIYLLSELLNF